MDRATKMKIAAGAGAAVLVALLVGVVGALAAAQVLEDGDGDRRAVERLRAEPFAFGDFRPFGDSFLERRFLRPAGVVDLDAAADYLELSESELRDRLRDGDTLAEVAEDEGKSVAGLVDALVAAAGARIDEEAAEAKEGLEECFEDLVEGDFPRGPFRAGCG